MISEPELDGGDVFVTSEVLTDTPPPGPPGPPRARRPWLWALGGAVLASAVWGGGLYAYGEKKETGPDLAGYKPVENLCELAEMKALGAILGKRGTNGAGPVMNEPSVSESMCSANFGGGQFGQDVSITYTLHKVIDPEHEFAATAQRYGKLQKIDGVGEQAYFDEQGGQGGALRVLDGQAEIEFQLFRQGDYEVDGKIVSAPPLDLTGIDVPMTQDMLALMAALKK
ncbi:hypothetical protein ACWFR1_20040 [Streptomyces sp. NPDC055103]